MLEKGGGRPVESLLGDTVPLSSAGAPSSAALPACEETRKAVVAAYAILGRRAFSRAELRTRLRRGGAGDEAVEGALDWLEARRLLDDRRYAQEAVRAGAERKGWGARKIRQWLHQRGIEPSLADEAASAISVEHEQGRASDLAARQRARGRRPEQVFRFLVARGFSADVAREAALRSDEEGEMSADADCETGDAG